MICCAPDCQQPLYESVSATAETRALKVEITLNCLDASHFMHGCDFPGHVWCLLCRHIKTYSGRDGYNVLGALNYAQPDLQVVTNDEYITATEVREMFHQLARVRKENDAGPVYVILDNARY